MNKSWWYLLGTIGIFLADRITKYFVLCSCMERCIINPILSFEVGFNRGITWGFFYSDSTFVFSFITAVIILVTCAVAWYATVRYRADYPIIGECFIVAGSLSNIVDRFVYGGVVDFIELSYNGWMWPSFNIADMFIVSGIIVMMYEHVKEGS